MGCTVLKHPTHGPNKFNKKRHYAKMTKMATAARSANRTLSMTPNAIKLREKAAARKAAGLPSANSKQELQKRQQRQQLE
jgi:molybdenum cofactor biosynthesis enzyme MoaA